jgi:lipopolysaccharide transport system permease protein
MSKQTVETPAGVPGHGDGGPTAALGAQATWIELRPPTRWLPRLDLRELWNYRELVFFLALRDVKLRYKQTFFGVLWALIQPLAGVLIFSIVFGRLAGLPSDGIPYPVFVYAGLIIWTYFAAGMTAAAQSLVENAEMVSKVYFPRVLAPLAAVGPGLIDLGVSLGIAVVFLVIYGVVPGLAILTLPLWILAGLITALAVGLWLSAINVKYRDVRYALPFLVQIWFFATPVVFPLSIAEGNLRYIFSINPVTWVVDGFRWALVDGPPPGLPDLVSALVMVVVLVTGFIYFRRTERRFADVI